MTLQELSRHLKLCEKLEQDEEILAALRAKAYPGAQQLDGMPHASGVNDKTGYLGAVIADMEASIKALRKDITAERRVLQNYVDSLRDERIRTIIQLRFICCMQWKEVAYMMGRSYTENKVKVLFHSFMKSNNLD